MKKIILFALLLSVALFAKCFDSNNDGECELDNCPGVYNPDQADEDNDGVGDACDPDFVPPEQPTPSPSINPSLPPNDDGSSNNGSPLNESNNGEQNESINEQPLVSPQPPSVFHVDIEPTPSPTPLVASEQPESISFSLGIREVVIPLPTGVTGDDLFVVLVVLALIGGLLAYKKLRQRKSNQ